MKLHPYQERAVQFCLDKKQAYIACDLGMGKTAIALKVIEAVKQPAFVFGPLRTIYNTWPEEIQKWTPHLTYRILHGPKKTLYGIEDVDIIIMNYQGLKWLSKQRYKWRKRMVIYDESSMVKSHSTQRFKLLQKMRPLWTDYIMALSATPAPNHLGELWSQYYLLDGGAALGKNITTFRNEYCAPFSYPGMAFTQYNVRPDKFAEIHRRVAPRTFRLEARDYLTMPEIIYNRISCSMPEKALAQYAKLEKDFFLIIDDVGIDAFNSAALSMKLRQFVQGGVYDDTKAWNVVHDVKLQALQELVESSAGQPILCAIQFKGELQEIRKAYPNVPVIAGGTSVKQAQSYINAWNEGQLPLLLCHPASISHGVNLQSGGHILLWYGLTWSLEQYLQLNGRLYRQGQRNAVVIHHLVMTETIDEVVLKALADKESVQAALLNFVKQFHARSK